MDDNDLEASGSGQQLTVKPMVKEAGAGSKNSNIRSTYIQGLIDKEIVQSQQAQEMLIRVEAAEQSVKQGRIAVDLAKARVVALRLKQYAAADSLNKRLDRVIK